MKIRGTRKTGRDGKIYIIRKADKITARGKG